MTFTQIPAGTAVFVDANSFIYHFTNEPQYGAPCTGLLKRIEQQDLSGFTSAHVLADVAHRLMTIEAVHRFGWRPTGIAARLRKRHAEIPKLNVYLQAVAHVPRMRLLVLPISGATVEAATLLSQQLELLTGDALVVAVMRQHGLTHLASLDGDFDRVPGITRYAPA